MGIITAWHHISKEIIVKCFKRCCISSAVDGTDDDDDLLWNDGEGDGDVRCQGQEDKHINCEDGDTDW